MLIATSIEKNFGTAPGEPIFGDEVQRFVLVHIEDPLLVGSGGGGGNTPGFTTITFVNEETGETRTISFGYAIYSSGGSSSGISDGISELIQSGLGADGGLQLYVVSAWLVGENGITYRFFGTENMWLPRDLRESTYSIPYDTIPGAYLGTTGVTQTNEPGWGGHAVGRDPIPAEEERKYSFDPKANVPFFSGIADENDIPTIRPSKYLVAFEVFGFEARIWHRNSVVVDTFPWTAGDRFHIIYSPERVAALVNSTLKWSS